MRSLVLLKRKIKFFFQRVIRGWDDSETWSLDYEFYKWLLPRLKRFEELTIAYPGTEKYPTLESWKKEIKNRCRQLELLIKDDWKCFDDGTYEDFHKWFAEEAGWLWW